MKLVYRKHTGTYHAPRQLPSWLRNIRIARNKILPISLIALLPLVVIVMLTIINANKTKAAWYDDAYQYRRRFVVTNSGSQQTDFQVSFVMDTAAAIAAGKMQADCDDIRVVQDNGNLLKHWIEEDNPGCDDADTVIWVKIPTIPASSIVLYVYYGNATAPDVADGDQVFLFFDDFNNGSTISGDWTPASTYSAGTYSVAQSGGRLSLSTSTVSSGAEVRSTIAGANGSTPFIAEQKLNVTGSSGTNIRNRLYMLPDQLSSTSRPTTGGHDYGLFSQATGPQPDVYWNAFTSTTVPTANDIKVIQQLDGTNFVFTILDLSDGSSVYTNNNAQTSLNHNWFRLAATRDGSGTATSAMSFDWVLIRKYASSAPTAGSVASEEKAPGPIGYWKLDEGVDNLCSGGANDACNGTGDTSYDALATTITWKSEENCVSGKCIYMDGSGNDNIRIPRPVSDDFTLAIWVRANGDSPSGTHWYQGYGLLDSEQSGVANDFGLSYVNNKAAFGVGNADTTISSNTNINDNRWHYIVATRTKSTGELRLYVDGLLEKTGTGNTNSLTAATYVYMGSSNGGVGTYGTLQGFLDEAKIYNYVRSEAQIKTDYIRGAAAAGSSVVLGAQDTSFLNNGLVGYWKLDGTEVDSSGNALTLINDGPTPYTDAKYSRGAEFTGSSALCLNNGANDALDTTGSTTLTAWIQPDDVSGLEAIISNKTNVDYRYGLYKDGANIRMYTGGSNTIYETTMTSPLGANVMTHVASVYDASTQKIRLYVNGELVPSTPTGIIPASNPSSSSAITIGCDDESNSYDGHIDEARVYNRALTDGEIRNLYDWAPGPMLHWAIDENTGTTVYDRSANGNTATINGPLWTPGKVGQALQFDGSNDTMNSSSTVNFGGGKIATVSFWLNWTTFSNNDDVALELSSNFNSNDGAFLVIPNTSGAPATGNFEVTIQDSATTLKYRSEYIPRPSAGVWHHYTIVLDNSTTTGDIKIYLNGAEQTTTIGTNTKDQSSAIRTDTLYVMNRGGSSLFGQGMIDDIRIYNYERTAKQAVEDMGAGHPGSRLSYPSPMGHWNFNEGRDNSCPGGTNDACNTGSLGAPLNGAQSGMATPPTLTSGWTSRGKVAGSLNFDGSNDYITITDIPALDITGDFSISAWVKRTGGAGAQIVSKTNDSADGGYAMLIGSAGEVYCRTNNGTSSTNSNTNSGKVLADGVWVHTAIVRSGTSCRVYINGVDETTSAGTHTTLTANSNNLIIGTRPNAGGEFWTGLIDEVKLFNTALSASEVVQEYTKTSPAAVLGAGDEGFGGNPPSSWWKLDENTGTTANDSSGNGISGTLTNGPIWTPGKVGSSLQFDGSNDYVTMGDVLDFNYTDSRTFCAWIRPTSTAAEYGIITKSNWSSPFDGWYFETRNGGGIAFAYVTSWADNAVMRESGATLSTNAWNYICAVYDNTEIYLYNNGLLLSTSDVVDTISSSINNAKHLNIGGRDNGSGWMFPGMIDDVKVYDYARTTAQIAYDYNRGGPVAWYKLDDCQGTIAYDSTGRTGNLTINPGDSSGDNDTAGTCNSGVTTEMWNDGSTGKRNASLGFDGTNDIASISDPSSGILDFGENDFSVAFWYKTSQTSSASLVGKGQAYSGSGGTPGFEFIIHDGFLRFAVDDSTAGICYASGPVNTAAGDGNWHHVIGTRQNEIVTIYFDGKAYPSNDCSGQGTINNSDSFAVGARSTGSLYTAGQIDDVQVYNYALSLNQVKKILTSGAVFFGPETGSP